MPQTSREAVLRLFQEDEPQRSDEPLSFRTIVDVLGDQYTKSTISARLSDLVRDGLLIKPSRDAYRLAYADVTIPKNLKELVRILSATLPERTIMGTVVWDATPFLAQREDGTPGPVRVVETTNPTKGETAWNLRESWTGRKPPFTREFADRETLIEAVAGEIPLDAPTGWPAILVGPVQGHHAATELTRNAIRLASTERILMDFLASSSPMAGNIVQFGLTTNGPDAPDPDKLFQAAEERNMTAALWATIAALEERIPAELHSAWLQRLPPPVRAIIGGDHDEVALSPKKRR